MAAKVHLDRGREPAQAIAVGFRADERGLGEVHFPGDILHPFFIGGSRKNTDCGRVAGEGFIGEGVDLVDGYGHYPSLV